MNQPAVPAPDDTGAPVTVDDEDEVEEALRLPGPLGRPRAGLPVVAGASHVPSALSTFNRLTGRLDRDVDAEGTEDEDEGGEIVAELGGTPIVPVRPRARTRG